MNLTIFLNKLEESQDQVIGPGSVCKLYADRSSSNSRFFPDDAEFVLSDRTLEGHRKIPHVKYETDGRKIGYNGPHIFASDVSWYIVSPHQNHGYDEFFEVYINDKHLETNGDHAYAGIEQGDKVTIVSPQNSDGKGQSKIYRVSIRNKMSIQSSRPREDFSNWRQNDSL
jgi:hypothetical protein